MQNNSFQAHPIVGMTSKKTINKCVTQLLQLNFHRTVDWPFLKFCWRCFAEILLILIDDFLSCFYTSEMSSGRVRDSRGTGFKPHPRRCIGYLSKTLYHPARNSFKNNCPASEEGLVLNNERVCLTIFRQFDN